MPRYPKVTMETSSAAMSVMSTTTTCGSTFGNISKAMILRSEYPKSFAASTHSVFLKEAARAFATLAYTSQPTIMNVTIMPCMPAPVIKATTITKR